MTDAAKVLKHSEKIRSILTKLEEKPADPHHVLRHAALVRYEIDRMSAPTKAGSVKLSEP